jgi:hypothetical protein
MTGTPLAAGSSTHLRACLENSHDESTSLEFVRGAQTGEPRAEHRNAT